MADDFVVVANTNCPLPIKVFAPLVGHQATSVDLFAPPYWKSSNPPYFYASILRTSARILLIGQPPKKRHSCFLTTQEGKFTGYFANRAAYDPITSQQPEFSKFANIL
jgi:hypothetical protein